MEKESVQKYMEVRGGLHPMHMITWLAKHLENKREIRKELSHWGAVRVMKDQAMEILKGKEPLTNFTVIPVCPDKKVHFMIYRDAGNQVYSGWIKTLGIKDIDHLSMETLGDIVEVMLSFGFSTTACQRMAKSGM